MSRRFLIAQRRGAAPCAIILMALAPPAAAQPRASLPTCTRLPIVDALAGRTPDSFTAVNGRPTRDERFRLADGLDPSRRTLLNVLKRPRDDNVTVREVEWLGKQCRLTIWFTQGAKGWRSIHAVRTSADAEA